MSRAMRAGPAIALLLLAAEGAAAQNSRAGNSAAPDLTLPALAVPDLSALNPPAARPQRQVPRRVVMQSCPSQGPGFVRVPGSATCVRVSGRAVGGVDLGSHGAAPVTAGRISIDTRTDSDLGPVRAFVRMGHGRP